MNRATLRTLWAISAAIGLSACGPDPEPQTAATPPPPPPATATVAPPPPPPAEPTAEERKKTAKAAMDAKDWGKAKTELSAVVAKSPNDVEAQKMLGQIAEAENDAAGATQAYFLAAKADGGKDEMLALAAAQGLYAAKRWDDLVGLMQTVTTANDKSMPAWMYLGLGQVGKEDWAAAEATYGKLTTAFADEPQLWAQFALVQAGGGKNDEAKKTAKTALDKWTEARGPKTTKEVKLGKGAEEIALIARAYRRAGDTKNAQTALDKYPVPKDETAPGLDVERGFLRLAAKDTKGATTLADKALKASSDHYAPAHLLKAAIAAQGKKGDEAKGHLASFDKAAPAFERSSSMPNAWSWERKWVETTLAGAPADKPAEKKPADKGTGAKPATPADKGAGAKPTTPAPGTPAKPATPAPGTPAKPATPAPGTPAKPATPATPPAGKK